MYRNNQLIESFKNFASGSKYDSKKQSFGGKIPNYNSDENSPVLEFSESLHIEKALPLIYNTDLVSIVDSSSNFILANNSIESQDKYYTLDNNLFATLVNDSIEPHCFNNSFDVVDYIYKTIVINEYYIPFYYCLLNKFRIIEGIYKVINSPRYESLKKIFKELFKIDVSNNTFIGINVKENIIDKYIFINKFQQILEIISKNNYSNQRTVETDQKIIQNIRNAFDSNKNIYDKLKIMLDSYGILEELKFIDVLSTNPEYVYCFYKVKYIREELYKIFNLGGRESSSKINFSNLVDQYDVLASIFSINKEVGKYHEYKQQIYKKLQKYNQGNEEKNIKKKFINEIIKIYKYSEELNKLRDYTGLEHLNLNILLLLIYFYIRITKTTIIEIFETHAFPINPKKCLDNLVLLDTGENLPLESRSISDISLHKLCVLSDNLPEIFSDVDVTVNEINYRNCVESSILQLTKLLFWNFDNGKYELSNSVLKKNNLLHNFMNLYIKKNKEDNDINRKFCIILSKIENISYIKNHSHEVNSNLENIIKIIYFLLTTTVAGVREESGVIKFRFDDYINENKMLVKKASCGSNDVLLDEINKIISPLYVELKLNNETELVFVYNRVEYIKIIISPYHSSVEEIIKLDIEDFKNIGTRVDIGHGEVSEKFPLANNKFIEILNIFCSSQNYINIFELCPYNYINIQKLICDETFINFVNYKYVLLYSSSSDKKFIEISQYILNLLGTISTQPSFKFFDIIFLEVLLYMICTYRLFLDNEEDEFNVHNNFSNTFKMLEKFNNNIVVCNFFDGSLELEQLTKIKKNIEDFEDVIHILFDEKLFLFICFYFGYTPKIKTIKEYIKVHRDSDIKNMIIKNNTLLTLYLKNCSFNEKIFEILKTEINISIQDDYGNIPANIFMLNNMDNTKKKKGDVDSDDDWKNEILISLINKKKYKFKK